MGPPESHWQVSTPPVSVYPAQISSPGTRSLPYASWQSASETYGTVAFSGQVRERCTGLSSPLLRAHPLTVEAG
jgi:hypothetical protein